MSGARDPSMLSLQPRTVPQAGASGQSGTNEREGDGPRRGSRARRYFSCTLVHIRRVSGVPLLPVSGEWLGLSLSILLSLPILYPTVSATVTSGQFRSLAGPFPKY